MFGPGSNAAIYQMHTQQFPEQASNKTKHIKSQ
jgi:hypothetical protein